MNKALAAAIKRSTAARNRFKKLTGFPKGRPGFIIDHMVPLMHGGPDTPSNMQWSTIAEAKAKDRWERDPSRWVPKSDTKISLISIRMRAHAIVARKDS